MDNRCLSVVMPVYNEKNTVSEIIQKVLKLDILKELIVVDDGSTDDTREILRGFAPDSKLKIIYHHKNRGKGAAVRTGLEYVTGEIFAIQDADLEYEPEELKELIMPIKKGFADAVYGSRLSGGKPQRMYLFWHKAGNRIITLIANILYNTTLSDIETCYKVIRADIIKNIRLHSRGFSIEPEITAKLLKRHLRIYEMPISYYGRTYEEGKKITWRQGISAIFTLLWYRIFE